MPLLAEASQIEQWFGPVLASLASLVATLFAYLSGRDKLRFDVTVVKMQAELAALTEKTNDCHRERDELKAEVAELRGRFDRHDKNGV